MKPVSFYLVTDTHYFEESLGAEGKAYEEYMKREQYFMKESGPITKATFNRIAEDKETQIVLIAGDLTKNGEIESHKSFIKDLYKLKESGKKIYIITAGHDYGTAFAFKNDERIDIEGADFDSLPEMYKDFGYGEAIAFDKPTHSYVAQIADGVRMLGICCDSFNQPKGAMDERHLAWAKEQLDKAKADNCSVIAMCHYPIIPSVPVFDLVGDAKIKEWRKIASFLADNGVELVLTGHMHIQSINEFYSKKGNRLIDICTACLPGSPAQYRKITIDENSVMNVTSIKVDDFGWDLKGLTVSEYCDNQFKSAILERIFSALRGGKGIVKLLKKFGTKIVTSGTVGFVAKLLLIKAPKSIRKKKLADLVGDIGISIFIGDMPYVEGTPEFEAVSKLLKRFSFIIKKIEPKLSKDSIKINLTDMVLNTIGSRKPFSDNNTQFKLK